MSEFSTAYKLIKQFKGDAYLSGYGVLPRVGELAGGLGKRAALVRDVFPGSEEYAAAIRKSLESSGAEVAGVIDGAAPNAPREDLFRITEQLTELQPDFYVSFGGGSTIDAAKAAEVLRVLGGSIDDYFGTGLVTEALKRSGKKLTPHVAIQTASSSAAHLTKYSNITDARTGQKKLIVDEAIVPARAAYDYEVSFGAPRALTSDGALDGFSHSLEVLYGAVDKPYYGLMTEVARETFRLALTYLPRVMENPRDGEGREALALATDLGGYAIMLGGTNGAHLTSFSLVDILSHGRACIMMNPYYTVFYAPAVTEPLRLAGMELARAGAADSAVAEMSGREAGMAVAEGIRRFEQRVSVPTTLGEVAGFSHAHIERALAAAKNPQLRMKLQNMPVPLTPETVDDYMGPVLEAGKTGDLSVIKNLVQA
ncbi:MAG: iron-containing alcohol dehydrogenase [Bryobacteraceae bacterium]|nr:iron-containing alcohol dehydrogenase [Bryobacteraceae bacterium]